MTKEERQEIEKYVDMLSDHIRSLYFTTKTDQESKTHIVKSLECVLSIRHFLEEFTKEKK